MKYYNTGIVCMLFLKISHSLIWLNLHPGPGMKAEYQILEQNLWSKFCPTPINCEHTMWHLHQFTS